MKPRIEYQRQRGMNVFEVMVVIACLLVLAAVLLPILIPKRPVVKTNCVSNLGEVGLCFRVWAGDNGDQYPMTVSVTNGGGMELVETGNVAGCLELLSNEMTPTPEILVCPGDSSRTVATNWNDLNGSHVSYFFSLDASNQNDPNMVLSGDDNLIVGGTPVRSGMLELSSNAPVFWSEQRHVHVGNIGFADGHVDMEPTNGLETAFQKTGLATNRIVIP